MMKKLKINSIQCLVCGKILVSTNRDQYHTCGCPNDCFIDGGLFYNRCGAMNTDLIKCLCEFDETPEPVIDKSHRRYFQII